MLFLFLRTKNMGYNERRCFDMVCKVDIRKVAEIAGFTVGWMEKKDT